MKQVSFEQAGQPPNTMLCAASVSNGLVFSAGCVGADGNGAIVEGLEAQTVQAIENMKSTLEAAGSGLDKVLKVLVFIADGKDAPAMNDIYKKYFPHAPARSCVVVAFPNASIKVELECVAEI